MSWRDLKPPDGWCNPERLVVRDPRPLDIRHELEWPAVCDPSTGASYDRKGVQALGGRIVLAFEDEASCEWFGEWLRSKRGWTAFMAWVDEKR
jgi:hypothetical protein